MLQKQYPQPSVQSGQNGAGGARADYQGIPVPRQERDHSAQQTEPVPVPYVRPDLEFAIRRHGIMSWQPKRQPGAHGLLQSASQRYSPMLQTLMLHTCTLDSELPYCNNQNIAPACLD
jgi:hypothetical protein